MNYRRSIVFKVLFLIPIAIALFGSPSIYGTPVGSTVSENEQMRTNYVNISSPLPGQNVTVGNLTIVGASSDNLSSNCTVYVGWNHSRPFQKADANGSMGVEDYSTWNFTFDPSYHQIINGTNLINSELSCFEFSPANVTSSSINITGVVNASANNFTDAGYLYSNDSFDETYDLQGLDADILAYDNGSTGDYNFDDISTDSSNYDNFDSSNDNDDDDDDSSGDDGSSEEDDGTSTGTGNNTYPLIDNGVFNIGAAGDWDSGSNARETALNMHEKGVDLALGLGDYAYSTGSDAVRSWWNNQMAPLHERFKGALGNHDTQDQSIYAQLFGQSDRWFYSFDKQGVHFVAINSEESFGPGSSQYKFIDQDLQSASTRSDVNWIVVFLHQPMYTSPSHHDPVSSLRNAYHPLFDKYDVDLVLQGHNHNYQRSFPIAYNSKDPSQPVVTSKENAIYNDPPGQIYAEVGTGGKESYSLDGKSSFISRQFTTSGGFLDVAFPSAQTMKGRFYDNSGDIKDEFTIEKSGTTINMAANDAASTSEDKPIDINVLANDKSANGLPAISSASASNTNLPVVIRLEGNGPVHGTAHINNDKTTVTYIPSPDYSGLDSFTYSVSPAYSQNFKSAPAKVSVTVHSINDPPQANNDNATTANSDDILIDVLANDMDPDGDTLRVIETSITSNSFRNDSRIVVNPDSTISYSPPNDFNGVDSFFYTISDDNNETATASVKININNDSLVWNTNTTSVIATNGTTKSPAENVSSSRINSNDTNSINLGIRVPPPLEDNKTSIQNITQVVPVLWNETERDRINQPADHTISELVGASQVSPKTDSSLQVHSERTYDSIRSNVTKLATEMAKGALDKAEQALKAKENSGTASTGRSTLVIDNRNLPEMAYAAKDSGQPVSDDNGAQGHIDHIGTNDQKLQTMDQLARQAEMVIDMAQKSLANISRGIEVVENLKSYHGPVRPDASQISDNLSPQTDPEPGNSRTEIDNLAKESLPRGIPPENKATSHTGKSDIRSAHSEDSDFVRKKDPKADAGDKQKVIEGTQVTLDGTESKSQESSRLSYSWKQSNGPKVRILDANSAIASFETPKVPSGRDEITLKFVLVVSDNSDINKRNSNNDKDNVIVIVREVPSLDHRIDESPTPQSSPDNKARTSNHAEDDSHSRDKDVDGSNGSKDKDSNTPDDRKNEDDADQPEPIKSPEADLTNHDNTSNDLTNDGDTNS